MVQFMQDRTHCAAWTFMGGGKTISTLTAFDEMRQAGEVKRLLVVAPLRVARSVWDQQAAEWEHVRHLRVSKIIGSRDDRLAALSTPADVYTINRENLCWLRDLFIQNRKQIRRWPFDMVALDESSSFKSQSANRFKAIRMLRPLIPRLVELTGTPAPNRLPDLWAQLYLLDRGQRLGRTESAFRERWFNAPSLYEYKWTPKPHARQEIYAAVADIVLSLNESDYMDLPPVIENFVRVFLPPVAMAAYRKFERLSVLNTAEGTKVTAISAGVLHNKKCQLANGSIYTDDRGTFEVFHDEKLDALVDMLREADGPVLVAYHFKADLARIKKRLSKDFGQTLIVDTLTTKASEDNWNAGLTDVLLLHPDSAGHGLNLQGSGSQHIIWFGLTANLEHVQQANARLAGGHRRGAGALTVSYIVADGTVDDDLVEMIRDKADEQTALRQGVAAENEDWLAI